MYHLWGGLVASPEAINAVMFHSRDTGSAQSSTSCVLKYRGMTNTPPPAFALTRRTVLAGAGALGVASALAACGDGTNPGSSTQDLATSSPATVNTADVPVGGGTIVADQRVVVTQPSQGEFKAFSAVCTHQGCIVAKVENTKITCTCHNSMFSVADGSVLSGPAPRALAARTVTVNGDTLTIS